MNNLVWQLNRFLYSFPLLRVASWLTLLAMLAVVVWFVIVFLPQQETIEDNAKTTAPAEQTVVIERHPYETLVAEAPVPVELTQFISQLHKVANQYQVHLEEVVYQPKHLASDPFFHYSIDFAVGQRYPIVKQFLLELLANEPYLALEQISFEREEIEDNSVTSQVRMKLFLGAMS